MPFIDLDQVIEKTTLGKSTIYAYCKSGKMPRPVKLGDRAVRWIEDEIDAWLEERIKASRTVQKKDEPRSAPAHIVIEEITQTLHLQHSAAHRIGEV